LLLLPGCDQRSLRQQADEIRQFSDKEDRIYSAEALRQIRHNYWTLHNGAWLGKTADGTIVRLDAPQAAPAPLPSRAFYTGWHLQLTISSADWRTWPPSANDQPFQAVYAITRHSSTNWEIQVTSGPETTPASPADIGNLSEDN
jgi:hypothetical protein